MSQRSINSLLEALLNSPNDAWRDDAAEDLANCADQTRAEEALFFAIQSPKLDDSLRRTCVESLATIWIRSGTVQDEKLRRLTGEQRIVAEAFLRAAHILPASTDNKRNGRSNE